MGFKFLDILFTTMNTGFQLFQLQEIDSAIDKARKRIEEIDNFIRGDKTLRAAQKALEAREKSYITLKNQFDGLNDEIQSRKNKKSQSESSLYSGIISNPKELQDLQNEIVYLNSSIAKMEDELFQHLIDLENSEKQLNQAKEALKAARSNFETEKSLLTGEKNQLDSLIASQQDQKSSLVKQIDRSSLEKYQAIRSSKSGLAVSKLMDGACGICGNSLTPSQCQQARSPGTLLICPSCGRIIYGS